MYVPSGGPGEYRAYIPSWGAGCPGGHWINVPSGDPQGPWSYVPSGGPGGHWVYVPSGGSGDHWAYIPSGGSFHRFRVSSLTPGPLSSSAVMFCRETKSWVGPHPLAAGGGPTSTGQWPGGSCRTSQGWAPRLGFLITSVSDSANMRSVLSLIGSEAVSLMLSPGTLPPRA